MAVGELVVSIIEEICKPSTKHFNKFRMTFLRTVGTKLQSIGSTLSSHWKNDVYLHNCSHL